MKYYGSASKLLEQLYPIQSQARKQMKELEERLDQEINRIKHGAYTYETKAGQLTLGFFTVGVIAWNILLLVLNYNTIPLLELLGLMLTTTALGGCIGGALCMFIIYPMSFCLPFNKKPINDLKKYHYTIICQNCIHGGSWYIKEGSIILSIDNLISKLEQGLKSPVSIELDETETNIILKTLRGYSYIEGSIDQLKFYPVKISR